MARFTKYSNTYADGKKVTYYVPLDPRDQDEADKLNEKHQVEIDAYNQAVSEGKAGPVKSKISQVDK